MKIILLLALLAGCKKDDWGYHVMVCPKNSSSCQKGGVTFTTLEDCEQFAREAAKLQPGIGRICIKGDRPLGIY